MKDKTVLVTGGTGFLGKAVRNTLHNQGYTNVIPVGRAQCDLTNLNKTIEYFSSHKPHYIIHLAAVVGGIGANRQSPATFMRDNLLMGVNVIEASRLCHTVDKVVQIGTVCSYPKYTPVPFIEDHLWRGFPEETNAGYGVAKKTLGLLLESYQQQYGLKSAYVIPVNLYGPYDNFDVNTSHVIPSLVKKCVDAVNDNQDSILCWGTGIASREFLYVDDAAEGIVKAMELVDHPTPINLGTGKEINIKDLVAKIASLCGFTGKILWDSSKPDGQPRRCLNTDRAKMMLGWEAKVDFDTGLKNTIEWYKHGQ